MDAVSEGTIQSYMLVIAFLTTTLVFMVYLYFNPRAMEFFRSGSGLSSGHKGQESKNPQIHKSKEHKIVSNH